MTEAERKRALARALTITLAAFAEQIDKPWIRKLLGEADDITPGFAREQIAQFVAYFPGTVWDPRLGEPICVGGRVKTLDGGLT